MLRNILAGVACVVAMACAGQAAAEGGYVTPPCGSATQPCNYDPSLGVVYLMDFSVPTDGTTQQWDFWLTNGDPSATLSLSSPNETFTQTFYGNGSTDFSGDVPGYKWSTTSSPGHLSIRVSGPRSYNNCSNPNIVGVCGVEYFIWGNGTALDVNSDSPGIISWSVATVPEPATWAMMLLGFFGLGAALRTCSRRVAASSAMN